MARETKKVADDAKNREARLAAFNEAIKRANSEMKSETGTLIAKLGERPMEVETISTGSVVLDSITGGGFPRGRLIEIYGTEASGKTSIALTAVGNVQKAGGNAVFIDLENALDPRYARKLGVDTNALAVSQPDYAEQALNLVYRLAKSETVDIIVVDSIASMIPQAELEGGMEQQTIGLLARLMSKSLKQIASVANRTGTTVVFINQTRDAIGGFSPVGTPQTTPGGKAMKFYASQRIEVKRLQQVKEGTTTVANEVRMTVRKNKIAPPFGVGITVLTFGRGINRAAEMIEVGPSYGVIERPNNRTYVDAETGEVLGTSKAAAVQKLDDEPDTLRRLEESLKKSISEKLFAEESDAQGPQEEEERPEGKKAEDVVASPIEDDEEQ